MKTIIKLSTYYVPGAMLRALPRLLTHDHTALVREVSSLFYREGTEAERVASLRPRSWEMTEAGSEHRSVQAAVLLALLLPQPALWCLAAGAAR